MLTNEHKRISNEITFLSESLELLYIELDGILANQAKNYSLTFGDKRFELFYPSTKEERDEQVASRKKYIQLILSHVLSKRVDILAGDKTFHTEDPFAILFALAEGEDPSDHTFRSSVVDDLKSQIKEEDSKYGKKRPLDKDAYHVKNEMKKDSDDTVDS